MPVANLQENEGPLAEETIIDSVVVSDIGSSIVDSLVVDVSFEVLATVVSALEDVEASVVLSVSSSSSVSVSSSTVVVSSGDSAPLSGLFPLRRTRPTSGSRPASSRDTEDLMKEKEKHVHRMLTIHRFVNMSTLKK